MTKPTGRPRGRPKTKHYETLTARVPQAFAAQVRAYMAADGQDLTSLIRDGLAWRITEGCPYWETVSDKKWGAQEDADLPPLSDVHDDVATFTALFRRLKPRWQQPEERAVIRAMLAALLESLQTPVMASDNHAAGENTSDTNTELPYITSDDNTDETDIASDMNGVPEKDNLSDANTETPPIASDTNGDVLPFDTTRYYLGKQVCPRAHVWPGTTVSLYRLAHGRQGGRCRQCDIEGKRQRRQQARQETPATP